MNEKPGFLVKRPVIPSYLLIKRIEYQPNAKATYAAHKIVCKQKVINTDGDKCTIEQFVNER